jgi:hypothetical protein
VKRMEIVICLRGIGFVVGVRRCDENDNCVQKFCLNFCRQCVVSN